MLNNDRSSCSERPKFELCRSDFSFSESKQRYFYKFDCSFIGSSCSEAELGLLDFKLGDLNWTFVDTMEPSVIESKLEKISVESEFVFIRCKLKMSSWMYYKMNNFQFTSSGQAEQFLFFANHLTNSSSNRYEAPFVDVKSPNSSKTVTIKSSKEAKLKNKPSINIVFFDAMSRTEAFYAWPNTISFLKNLSSTGERKVLDFRLSQSLYYQTFYHFHSLFNGMDGTAEVHFEEILAGTFFLFHFFKHNFGNFTPSAT